ncbi:MAG TPA: hypothetical protein VMS86_13165 [Thermoanaerobaculia bacterium]|nr:hypothetical protein [Thermoanaerobaculia bacterium]
MAGPQAGAEAGAASERPAPPAEGKLRLVLVIYEKKVLEVECDEVTLPGKLGYFGVLPGHVPLIAILEVGELMYRIGSASGISRCLGASARWPTTW